jgi:uncharacterized membrane protein YsdA (DUF1294 family)
VLFALKGAKESAALRLCGFKWNCRVVYRFVFDGSSVQEKGVALNMEGNILHYLQNGVIVLTVFLLFINLGGFIVMGIDKKKSQKGDWRVPEKRLFGFAACGGALGVLLGMYGFRHKTKHWSFRIGVPLLLLINIAIVGYLYKLLLGL